MSLALKCVSTAGGEHSFNSEEEMCIIFPCTGCVKIAKNPFGVRKCPECPKSRTPDKHGQTGGTVSRISIFDSSKSADPEWQIAQSVLSFAARNLPPSAGVKVVLQHSGPPHENITLFQRIFFDLSPMLRLFLLWDFYDFFFWISVQ
jgi:hypothetical protein